MNASVKVRTAAVLMGFAVLSSTAVMAQTTGSGPSGSTASTRTDVQEVREDRDWGWLGLIGLAGLLGLKRREHRNDIGQVRPAAR